MPRKILVAVAWPYVNGEPHLGHIAGMVVPADIFARYHRIVGNEVAMVSGSDMHGTPTALKAAEEGVSPEVVATRYHEIWSKALADMSFAYDLYTHTHTDRHIEVSQELFLGLQENGHLTEATQSMPFSETEQRFLSDRFVEGTCPHCGHDSARGDQCDNCGRTLDPIDLIDIRSKQDGSTPVFKDTTHLMLKLGDFQEQLEEWVSGKDEWRANVRNQTLGMLHEGLHDRAMTRDIDWGVPVPVEGYESKRIYVWFEAVIGYLSATRAWAEQQGKPDTWKKWWVEPDGESYYFQGKDNVAFHTIILPSILLGNGGLNLPTEVVANEYLTFGGADFSKSTGHAVWVPDFLTRYEADPLRYYLASIMPETSDSEFTWEGFHAANNNELVATFGNFVHRVLTITTRNFENAVPTPGELGEDDQEALDACDTALKEVSNAIDARRFRDGLRTAMRLARHGNQYIDSKEPWKVVKTDKEAAGTALWVGLNIIATLRTVFYPFMPTTADKIHGMLFTESNTLTDGWDRRVIVAGAPIEKPTPLFRKLDDSIIEEENARLTGE
ncbi:MAG: methionine--tRNA ligase [Dehalococcoidia bacterium]|nr:methionine--tRNA ligase [Chloroflexota bacterium]MDP7261898.1 methionine--tRNA ligase [Dehalococcoidia bacterium]MDP7485838.1 methionine--tRNA ligase [Dehalococcoidia bacterium]